jgi:alpha-D-ribose 1-methylphosphonate 5-triphosphate synthase subunit PhnH
MDATVAFESRRLTAKVAACRFDALESQSVFKVMLDTIAHPGTIELLPESISLRLPSVLAPVVVLADVETRVHVIDSETFVWAEAITSVTGAHTALVEQADLVAVPVEAVAQLASIFTLANPGSAFAPESGARVVIGVHDIRSHGLGTHSGVQLVLRGPGVDGERSVCIDGISESDVEAWKHSNSRFPAGIDLWFTTEDGRVLGIPRSTHVEISATWPTQERI